MSNSLPKTVNDITRLDISDSLPEAVIAVIKLAGDISTGLVVPEQTLGVCPVKLVENVLPAEAVVSEESSGVCPVKPVENVLPAEAVVSEESSGICPVKPVVSEEICGVCELSSSLGDYAYEVPKLPPRDPA
jgi:hypothetical protein